MVEAASSAAGSDARSGTPAFKSERSGESDVFGGSSPTIGASKCWSGVAPSSESGNADDSIPRALGLIAAQMRRIAVDAGHRRNYLILLR